jgi:tetratricopeptide (TPR) repeat protein
MDELAILIPMTSDIEPPKKTVRVLGIDLGTTNSTVAEVTYEPAMTKLPGAHCVEIEQYTTDGEHIHLLVPSVVALHAGREIIGEGAKRLRAKSTEKGLVQNVNLFYECKNDMGIRKTYHKAAEGYRSAAEIGGHLLRFLHQAAIHDNPENIDRVVVTVPASFQAAQRNDTVLAAQLAGLEIKGGDLLDEPVAAFIDYLTRHAGALTIARNESKRLLIFDFGGGTCDVAVFKLSKAVDTERLNISPLAVSRYHRLGGCDIDMAILYEELIPQLIEQNDLDEFSLGFNDKKRFIEPSYIGIAEALKLGLCREISRLVKFGKYDSIDKNSLVKTQPGQYTCRLADGSELKLQTPKLSAARFEELLKPFIDMDVLCAKESEYRTSCSVLAPIQDALERSNLTATDVDYCLLVGGSCLIPQVEQAIGAFFPKAALLTYPDPDSIQTAVARGAAYHALSLAIYGRGIIQPVCNDTIAVMTGAGSVDLIPKGAVLPYPADGGYTKMYDLIVPETSIIKPVPLRLEVVAGKEQRVLLQRLWEVSAPVNKGEKLCLEYRYDENQCLDLRLRLADYPAMESFTASIENPLTNVVNPQQIRLKIDELEEDMRTGKIPAAKQPATFVELAESYAELRQHEKALEYLSGVLRVKNKPDAEVLNKMAIYCGEMGDHDREEKLYREAAVASSWVGPWFNLALLQKSRKKYAEALESVNKAIEKDSSSPYLVLRAMLHEAIGNKKARDTDLKEALADFDQPTELSDWALGWLVTAARMTGDKVLEEKAAAEQRRRKQKGLSVEDIGGVLPGLTQTMQRRG